jgi:hypothetical protein
MRWSATRLGGTCLFILGLGGGAWFFPGDVTPAQSQERTPAEVIAFRFPGKWEAAQPQTSTDAATSVPKRVASVEPIPQATYALASADPRNLPVGFTPRSAATREQTLPTQALAYAAPEPEVATHRHTPAAVERATAAPQTHERRAHVTSAPKPVKQPTNVFSDSEIAAIGAKLKLSPHQQRYWPAVASALRNIDYVKQPSGRSTSVDPNSSAVQQLKSAAFPLIMSFDEEQKSQVRQVARNKGLTEVAAAF